MRIIRAEALGQDILDAHGLQDRANRATCDNPGTRAGRLEQDASGAMLADHRERDRSTLDKRNLDHGFGRRLLALGDRRGNFVGLAVTDTDLSVGIADHDERAEAESTTAFDDLRDTINIDDVVDQIWVAFLSTVSHNDTFLEFQPAFTRAIRHGRNAPVIDETVPVEYDFVDPFLLNPLGQDFSDLAGLLDLLHVLIALAKALLNRRGAHQGMPAHVVNDLSVDMLAGAKDRKPRARGRTENRVANGTLAPLAPAFKYCLFKHCMSPRYPGRGECARCARAPDPSSLCCAGFTDFANNALILIANALALIGLRRAQTADLRGDFAQQLFIEAAQLDLGLALDRDLDPRGDLEQNRMAKAQVKAQ